MNPKFFYVESFFLRARALLGRPVSIVSLALAFITYLERFITEEGSQRAPPFLIHGSNN